MYTIIKLQVLTMPSNSKIVKEIHRLTIMAASLALISVATGAFGAHALKSIITAERLVTWQTGVEYLMAHALAILLVSRFKDSCNLTWLIWSLRCLFYGVTIFSGSLFLLVLLNKPIMGAITPIGGLLMIIGWLAFIVGLIKQSTDQNTSD